MVRSSSRNGNGSVTGVKTPVPSSSPPPRISSPVFHGTVNSNATTIKPYNKYGWFLDSEEAEYEEESLSGIKMSRREAKWTEMTKDDRKWNKYVKGRFETVKWRCRKGIPHTVRGRAWFYLCGGHRCLNRDPDGFEQLSNKDGDPKVVEEITRDLHRQFPNHFMFANVTNHDTSRPNSQSSSGQVSATGEKWPNGQDMLFKLLKAYSILHPKVGYCQAQSPIACALLMVMPPEHAFWSFCSINDLYLVGYFDHGLEQIQLHGDMLMAFIKKFYPSVHKMLTKQDIVPMIFMTEWFMCLYTRTLPWPLVLRIWDMFMCEGIIVIFKVAIVLVGTALTGERKDCTEQEQTLRVLRRIPEKYVVRTSPAKKGDGVLSSGSRGKGDKGVHYTYPLLDKVMKLDLTEHDLQREHAIQSNERRAKKKQLDEARKVYAMNKKQAVDTTDAQTVIDDNVAQNGNGSTVVPNGSPNKANGTMNGRPHSSLSRGGHRHSQRRAPFIEFEFALGGKVITNKPGYKPAPSYGNVGNGQPVPNGQVSTTFTDGPSGRMIPNGSARRSPSPPRMERSSSVRKSASRSPGKSNGDSRSSSIERNRRSGSSRRSHSRERESPRKERIKAEGSPLRNRKHDHKSQERTSSGQQQNRSGQQDSSRQSNSGHRDKSDRDRHDRTSSHREERERVESHASKQYQTQVMDQKYQSQNARNESRQSGQPELSGQLTVGQYNRTPTHTTPMVPQHTPNRVMDTDRATSPTTVHTHFVRDSREGLPKEVSVEGTHDFLCRSPVRPSKEVIIPIQVEAETSERSRSRSSHVSGFSPMSVENGRMSSATNNGRTSTATNNGRTSATGRVSATREPIVDTNRHVAVRTSTPISIQEERPRSAHYTVIDHTKSEFHESSETVIYPVVKSREIPIQFEGSGRSSGLRSDGQQNRPISRSEERQMREQERESHFSQRILPKYEGSGRAFGAASGSGEPELFRPFSRSVSGTNPYTTATSGTISSKSILSKPSTSGGATGYGKTPNGGPRHAMVH